MYVLDKVKSEEFAELENDRQISKSHERKAANVQVVRRVDATTGTHFG